jgi:hypothetical protein
MVGQGVLRECLLDPDVEGVLAIVRNSSLPQHDKLRETAHQDVSDLSAIDNRLSGYDAKTVVWPVWLTPAPPARNLSLIEPHSPRSRKTERHASMDRGAPLRLRVA